MSNADSSSPGQPDAEASEVFESDSNAPWLARQDWASGELQCHASFQAGMIVVGILGMVMLSFALAFAYALPRSIQANGYYALIPVLISGPLGIALIFKAASVMAGGLKTGSVVLRLDFVPVPLDGPLRGEIRMANPIPAGQAVRLKLQCVSMTETQGDSDSGGSINSNVVWEDEATVPSDGSGVFQVAFVTPADAPSTKARPTRRPSGNADIWWVEWHFTVDDLSGKASRRHAEFELPVFRVAETASQVADAEAIRAERTIELEGYRPARGFKVRITPLAGGGTEFFFPPVHGGANAGFQTTVWLIMAGIFAACTRPVFNDLRDGITQNLLELVLYAGWGIVTLLLSFWVLRLWFAPERVTIANGMLSETAGLFGRTRTLPLADLTTIHVVPGSYTKRSAIRIRGSGWHVLEVGDGIRERRDAEWLAAQMSRAAGIKPVGPIPVNNRAEQLEVMQKFFEGTGLLRRNPPSFHKPEQPFLNHPGDENRNSSDEGSD